MEESIEMISQTKKRNEAVSPVIGVMLMLVVAIIIAAVVSSFAGGIITGQKKAPAITVNTEIRNDGTYAGSWIEFDVNSVENPIPSKDIQITTTWSTTNKNSNGEKITGGANVTGPWTTGLPNYHQGSSVTSSYYAGHVPIGYGVGMNRSSLMVYPSTFNVTYNGVKYDIFQYPEQMYGNYTLMGGTKMRASPGEYGYAEGTLVQYGYTYIGNGRFKYAPYRNAFTASDVDGMQAILGKGWENLRAGDTVQVSFFHRPSGKIIYKQIVQVGA